MESTFVSFFLKEGFIPHFPSFIFLSVLSSNVLILYEENIFLIFLFYDHVSPLYNYNFTNITSTNIKPFCTRRWVYYWMRESGGNALNFGRWIWGDQISSPKTMNVIAVVGTKHEMLWPELPIYSHGIWLFDKFENIIHELRW